jgi:hypothetical protein
MVDLIMAFVTSVTSVFTRPGLIPLSILVLFCVSKLEGPQSILVHEEEVCAIKG